MSQEFLKLSWLDVEVACGLIAKKIKTDNIKFTSIMCVGRGGMIPSRILSDILNISNVMFLEINAYDKMKLNKVNFQNYVGRLSNQHILIVDDILDTGTTLDTVISKVIQAKLPSDQPILTRTATICYKNVTPRKPSYYHFDVDKSVWVEFPWETYETERELSNVKCTDKKVIS